MREPLEVARYIFMNDQNELRSGWRVIAFFFFFFLAASLLAGLIKVSSILFPSFKFLVVEPLESEYAHGPALISVFVANLRNLAAAVIASAICARQLERRGFASVGFKLHRGWVRDFGWGSLLGVASLTVAVGIAAAVGAMRFDVHTTRLGFLAYAFGIVAFFFLLSGATEELIFRGFSFQALIHNLGAPAALAIASALFGLAHLRNPSASALSTINTMLAGVWLGLAYLMTRSLWLATGLHCSWNFAMVFIFGLPVSGFTGLDEFAWLRGSSGAPLFVSGGSYGPEGGVAATLALILSTLAIWKSGLFTPSDEMLAAIKHGKREPAFVSVVPEKHGPDG
jgi:hypothetical protein